MPAYRKVPQPNVAGLTLGRLSAFRPSLVTWGVGAAAAVSLFMGAVPIYKKDILQKVPIISSYFTDKTPDSDKPF